MAKGAAKGDPAGVRTRLKAAGLRSTRQRVALANLLFQHGQRHVSAELLYAEAVGSGISVSLATIYNTLNQFTEAGMLRQVSVDAERSYFDTNAGFHQHFYIEGDRTLVDIPDDMIVMASIPSPPQGTAIDRIDVVIRVRRT